MRKLVILLAVLFTIGTARSETFSIYYVNMQKILNNSAKGKQAKSILESKVREVQEKIKRMQQEIENLKKELSSNPVLSAKARTEKENQLQQKIRDLQRFQQDSRAEIANLERQYTYQIINDVVKLIDNYRKENNIPYIVEKSEAGIISADPKYDITDKIIKIYDSQVK